MNNAYKGTPISMLKRIARRAVVLFTMGLVACVSSQSSREGLKFSIVKKVKWFESNSSVVEFELSLSKEEAERLYWILRNYHISIKQWLNASQVTVSYSRLKFSPYYITGKNAHGKEISGIQLSAIHPFELYFAKKATLWRMLFPAKGLSGKFYPHSIKEFFTDTEQKKLLQLLEEWEKSVRLPSPPPT